MSELLSTKSSEKKIPFQFSPQKILVLFNFDNSQRKKNNEEGKSTMYHDFEESIFQYNGFTLCIKKSTISCYFQFPHFLITSQGRDEWIGQD